MVDITGIVIEKLKEASNDFNIWSYHHLTLTQNESLTPIIENNQMNFPTTLIVTKKEMKIEDKLRYYFDDLESYQDAKAKYLKSQIIQLLSDNNEH